MAAEAAQKAFGTKRMVKRKARFCPCRIAAFATLPCVEKPVRFPLFPPFFPERKTCGWKRGFQRFWPFFLNVVLTVSACQGPFGMARTHSLLPGSWLVGTPLDGPRPVLATITGNGAYCLKVVPYAGGWAASLACGFPKKHLRFLSTPLGGEGRAWCLPLGYCLAVHAAMFIFCLVPRAGMLPAGRSCATPMRAWTWAIEPFPSFPRTVRVQLWLAQGSTMRSTGVRPSAASTIFKLTVREIRPCLTSLAPPENHRGLQ